MNSILARVAPDTYNRLYGERDRRQRQQETALANQQAERRHQEVISALQPYEMAEGEERSLIGSLRDKTVGGVSSVFNLLDLPGSMVRDVLTLNNPFDQLLSPMSADNRTTGEQMLQQYGLAGKKDTWGRWGAGLATEILTDPLTYLTFGAGALTKTGKLAKAAGITKNDFAKVAAKKAGKEMGAVGAAKSRMTTTLADIARYGDDAAKARARQLIKQGKEAGKDISGDKMGRLFNVDVPFRNTRIPFTQTRPVGAVADAVTNALPEQVRGIGAGERSLKAAERMDKLGQGIRHFRVPGTELQPLDAVARTFDASIDGASTAFGRVLQRGRKQAAATERADVKLNTAANARLLKEAGVTGSEYDDVLREYLEIKDTDEAMQTLLDRTDPIAADRFQQAKIDAINAGGSIPDAVINEIFDQANPKAQALYDVGSSMRRDNRRVKFFNADYGGPTGELDDDYANYAARYLWQGSDRIPKRDAKTMSARTASDIGRIDEFRDIRGGTLTLKRLAKDERLNEMLSQKGRDPKEIADYIAGKYAADIDDAYRVWNKDKGDFTEKATGRYEKLVERLYRIDPETRKMGIFGNSPLLDHQARMLAAADQRAAILAVEDALTQPGVLKGLDELEAHQAGEEWVEYLGRKDDSVHLSQLLEDVGLRLDNGDGGGFGKMLAEGLRDKLGRNVDHEGPKFGSLRVNNKQAEELKRVMQVIKNPDYTNELLDLYDSTLNFYKSGLTGIWPAFHSRNFISGHVMNRILGIGDAPSIRDANRLVQGSDIAKVNEIPAVREEFARRGGDVNKLTNEEANDVLRDMITAYEVTSKDEGWLKDMTGRTQEGGGDAVEMTTGSLPEYLGTQFHRSQDGLSNIKRDAAGYTKGLGKYVANMLGIKSPGGATVKQRFNPFRVRGLGGRTSSDFAPAAAGEALGEAVEGSVRIAPFLKQLREGTSAIEAARRVGAAQVIYSGKNFTPVERQVFKRLFPFYSFSSRVLPTVAAELATKPGGTLKQVMRAQSRLQESDELAPDYVRESASIPLGDSIGKVPDGTDRYLTGFGLMHEDPFSFSGGARGTMLELASRLTPTLKFPLEMMTNQSFFQKGPNGGRKLDDLDPNIGRLAANLGLANTHQPSVLPKWAEHAISNSPLARATAVARGITDKRKNAYVKALNLLTGVRIQDISPRAKEGIARDLLNRAMKDAGARTYERLHFKEDDLLQMSEAEQLKAKQLQGVAKYLSRLAKERAADQEK